MAIRSASETKILKEIQIALSHGDTRLWRNNNGEAWAGYAIPAPPRYRPGAIVIERPVRVNFGLCAGSADLVGLRSVRVTQAMVGSYVAVFAGVEVKSATGSVKPDQAAWVGFVEQAGGYGGIARSVEDARVILRLS